MSGRRTRRSLSQRDEDTELDRLREQLRLLTIDNQALRSFISQQGYSDAPARTSRNGNDTVANIVTNERKLRRDSTNAVPPEKSCSCKGNCSTRQCGCVKRNNHCTEFCRCGHDLCQNSEPEQDNDDDDKENDNSQLATTMIKVEAPTEPEVDFNPMVPRRQLSRTPIRGQNQSDNPQLSNSA